MKIIIEKDIAPILITSEKEAAIIFTTNYNDKERNIFNISDIEEKTKFKVMIADTHM